MSATDATANPTSFTTTNPIITHITNTNVAVDYGMKRNILRNLVAAGARVTVVPAMASFAEIMALKPDGIFLSNGPGDPASMLSVVDEIKKLTTSKTPTVNRPVSDFGCDVPVIGFVDERYQSSGFGG